MSGGSVTLKDIARQLELSISTIGRALTDDPQISVETRSRVKAAAAELGYVAHSAARAMRSGHSSLVGLIIPDIENEFYGTLAKALAEVCAAADLQLVLAITEDDPASEEKHVRALSEARAAGLVITASPRPTRETLNLLGRSACVQLIRRVSGLAAPWFGINEDDALFAGTSHLTALGHRKIGYLGVSASLSTGRSRLAGYQRALRQADLAEDEALVFLGAPRAEFGAAAFEAMWRSSDRPTAIVAAGARLTVGMLQAVARLGVAIPGDVSVVGYGEAPWWNDGLTTIALPVREIALSCGEFLVRHIREARSRAAPAAIPGQHAVTFASTLEVGGSSRAVSPETTT
jgi:LacI family transcriptional regulator